MSFDLSWIVIPTAQRTALMEAMRLEPTGETGNWGDAEDWSLLELKSGWSVLISKDELFLEDEEAAFARISSAGALNWGCVNETAMVSGSTWVEGGSKHWSIEWNGSRGTDGLSSSAHCFSGASRSAG